MLENQAWMKYATELSFEWKQAKDEGRDVDCLKEVCEIIGKEAIHKDCSALAQAVRDKLLQAPILDEYDFVEPSDLESIRAERGMSRHSLNSNLTDDLLKDKIRGAWIGRISGCLLGKPVECSRRERIEMILKSTNNYPMNRYITSNEFSEELKQKLGSWNSCWADTIGGISPIDDDTNYTVFALKLIDEYGKNFKPNDVLEAWLSWIPIFSTCTAERVAYRNAAMGLYAPETANYNNPYREWIGAQIRGDFFGYLNPGNPELAAEMAWRDGSISHVKNGIYGEMFVAAMIATAAVCDDIMTIIEVGLDQIPQKCRLRRYIEVVIKWYNEKLTIEQVINKIHETYDEKDPHDWCHTNSNAMIVVASLLYGKKDFGKTICLAVQIGFDTDCNGATVGSILGILTGYKAIPSYWYACYNQRLLTSISGYHEVTVDQLASKTLELIKSK